MNLKPWARAMSDPEPRGITARAHGHQRWLYQDVYTNYISNWHETFAEVYTFCLSRET